MYFSLVSATSCRQNLLNRFVRYFHGTLPCIFHCVFCRQFCCIWSRRESKVENLMHCLSQWSGKSSAFVVYHFRIWKWKFFSIYLAFSISSFKVRQTHETRLMQLLLRVEWWIITHRFLNHLYCRVRFTEAKDRQHFLFLAVFFTSSFNRSVPDCQTHGFISTGNERLVWSGGFFWLSSLSELW